MPTPDIPRDEVEAALAARHELGPDYEPAVVDSLVDKLDQVIDRRVAERLEHQHSETSRAAEPGQVDDRTKLSFALGIVSITLGIPLTAITSERGGMAGILLVWIAIVLVNVSFSWTNRRR